MKKVLRILALCMAVMMLLTACGAKNTTPAATPAPRTTTPPAVSAEPTPAAVVTLEPAAPSATPAPTATSEDAELYVAKDASGTKYVVNAFGQRATGYTVDAGGNICDLSGAAIVLAANTTEFAFISTMQFAARNYKATLTAKRDEAQTNNGEPVVKQYPVSFNATLSILPINPANGIVVLSSSNPDVAEIRANSNALYVAVGDFNLADGELAIRFPTDVNSVNVMITAKTAGQAVITAKALTGGVTTTCIVTVVNGEPAPEATPNPDATPAPTGDGDLINASGDPTSHVHHYTPKVVEPTETEKGYTIYECECGHSYIDNWTAPLMPVQPTPAAHVHHYVATVIAPTETEQGYTIHVCECGDSYCDSFVPALGGND